MGLLLQRLSDLKILNLTSKKSITNEAAEIARLDAALEKAKTELEAIKDHAFAELGADKAAIFEAHLLVLNDPELVKPSKR